MSEKVYSLDEIRDKYVQVKNKLLQNKDIDVIYYMVEHLIKSEMPKEDIYPLLQEISILCDPLAITQDIKDKIDEVIRISLKSDKNYNLAQDVRDYVLSTNGHFLSTDVHKCTQVSTRKDKKNVSEVLRRLVEEGVIERYGKRNGCFRRINKECEKINWAGNRGEKIDLILPFSLNEIVEIHPRNMIVVAGVFNAGKTTFLLNVVALNLDFTNEIYYFSSEMGEKELKDRIEAFGIGYEPWEKGCNFYERSDYFADVIYPNGINIIDYFEISDNFYKIGEDFKKIYDKLKNGIAIIALQKNPDKKIGRGGTFGIEKPRLYLILDERENYNIVEIVKAKNYITEFNPRGYTKKFKITHKGSGLLELGGWEAP